MKCYIQAVESRYKYIYEHLVIDLMRKPAIRSIEVFTDYDMRGPKWNAERIWGSIADSGKPGLVLQDDVIVHEGFSECLNDLLPHLEEMQAISLFVPPRKKLDDAADTGINFIRNYDFLWMPGILLHPNFAAGLASYAAERQTIHDDSIVRDYAKSQNIPIWNTVPSLIQHNLTMRSTLGTASVIGGHTRRETRVWSEVIEPGHFRTVNAVDYRG